jgi:penicillin-binding protein 1A
VELADAVGLNDVARVARQAGIRSPIDPTPSMALGTVAVSPLELAAAYGAFAGLGDAAVPRMILQVRAEDGSELYAAPPPQVAPLLDPGVAYLVTNVLQDAVVRGTGAAVGASGLDVPAAGKTGTTNDSTDTWFVGYTPDVVAAVWVGFDERRPIMGNATGGHLAAPAWARMMKRVYTKRPAPAAWRAPRSVFAAEVDAQTGAPLADGCDAWDGSYRELFLRGKAPAAVCPESGGGFWNIFRSPGWGDDDERREAEKERERAEKQARRAAEEAEKQARKAEERLRKEWRKRMKEWEKRMREAERRRREREEREGG